MKTHAPVKEHSRESLAAWDFREALRFLDGTYPEMMLPVMSKRTQDFVKQLRKEG